MRTLKEAGAFISLPLAVILALICRALPGMSASPVWIQRWDTWAGNTLWDDNP